MNGGGKSHRDFLLQILPHVRVFARVAPKQKELVITMLGELGYVTLMCGDGTNDVGALKHAHVGVAILSDAPERLLEKTTPSLPVNNQHRWPPANAGRRPPPVSTLGPLPSDIAASVRSPRNSSSGAQTGSLRQRMLRGLEEGERDLVVRLGDASIAAPFTSKLSSTQC
ncbi:hypothetical protein J437_LFUL016209, partial [Ladona fulva]